MLDTTPNNAELLSHVVTRLQEEDDGVSVEVGGTKFEWFQDDHGDAGIALERPKRGY